MSCIHFCIRLLLPSALFETERAQIMINLIFHCFSTYSLETGPLINFMWLAARKKVGTHYCIRVLKNNPKCICSF